MELEDFKKAWKQNEQGTSTPTDMLSIIKGESRSPLADLRRAFRKQRIALAVMMIVVINTFARHLSSASSYVLFSTYVAFCLFVIGALVYNSRQVEKMETMEGPVKATLQLQIRALERHMEWQGILVRGFIILFIILLEVIPYFQYIKMLNTWHSLPVGLRFLGYGGFLVLQYFLSRFIKHRKFGRHLDRLKSLLEEAG